MECRDGQTDRQRNRRARPVMQPIRSDASQPIQVHAINTCAIY